MTVSFFTVKGALETNPPERFGESLRKERSAKPESGGRQVASLPRTRSPLNDKAKEGTLWQISYKRQP